MSLVTISSTPDDAGETAGENTDTMEVLEPDPWKNSFSKTAAIGLGGTEVVIGVASVVFGIEGILVYMPYGYVATGVWCGIAVRLCSFIYLTDT